MYLFYISYCSTLSERSCICVLGVSILPFSPIFLLDFWIVRKLVFFVFHFIITSLLGSYDVCARVCARTRNNSQLHRIQTVSWLDNFGEWNINIVLESVMNVKFGAQTMLHRGSNSLKTQDNVILNSFQMTMWFWTVSKPNGKTVERSKINTSNTPINDRNLNEKVVQLG
jgi:hypothetical protein